MNPNPGRQRAARWLAALALLAASAATQAAFTVYDNAASFAAATGAAGLDDFDDLSPDEAVEGPIARSAGSYGYSMVALTDTSFISDGSPVPPGYLLAAGSASDRWLSTNAASDTLRFFSLSGTSAIGGLFFGSDVQGQFAGGTTIEFLATDAQGTQAYTLTGADVGSFIGFVSDTTLVSLTVRAWQDNGAVWVTANDLQLAAAVPEPQTLAMLLGGLALLGAIARRRRH